MEAKTQKKTLQEIGLHDLKVHSNYFANAVCRVRSAALIKYASAFFVVCLFSLGLPFIAVSLAGSGLRTEAVSGGFLRPRSRF